MKMNVRMNEQSAPIMEDHSSRVQTKKSETRFIQKKILNFYC